MRHNGRFCKSGMAFNVDTNKSMCTRTEFITQALGKLKSGGLDVIGDKKSMSEALPNPIKNPYECNPFESNSFCWLHYNITEFKGAVDAT